MENKPINNKKQAIQTKASKSPEFHSKNKLWSGRFTKANDAFVEKFTQSVDLDQKLAHYDIKGYLAHANMLNAIGVLSKK